MPGLEATYVSLRGFLGRGIVVLEAFSPAGRGVRYTVQIHVT
ncbi:MAG TPA: hypothetical protein VFR21_04095 [Bradyrhizobium sp.]|jgi:hypothetical protein|nr:hypothetical protein [Bradyrhizobium sp.]